MKRKDRLQAYLLQNTLDQCLSRLGQRAPKLSFIAADTPMAEIRRLALDKGLYAIKDGAVIHYYYYSEPGNPFCTETYVSLEDFVFSLGLTRARTIYLMAAMKWTVVPDDCEFPMIKAYLERVPLDRRIDQVVAAMEVQKPLATHLLGKIDAVLERLLARFTAWLVFNEANIDRRLRKACFLGKWTSTYFGTRVYHPASFERIKNVESRDVIESNTGYRIFRQIGRMSVLHIDAPENGLPSSEHLMLAPGGDSLIVYDDSQRMVFRRTE